MGSGAESGEHGALPRHAPLAGAGLLLLLYGVLKAYALAPALSDENIYFYMCRRIAEGAIPYRDFFFAHPPLHLLPGALAALPGFSFPVMKAIPAVFAALAAIAVYRAARRAGGLAGLVAMALFLFAFDLLRASSHYTGVIEASALLAWALERACAGRPAAAGALAGAAALVAFYAVPPAAGIALWLLLRKDPRAGGFAAARRFAVAYAVVLGGVNLICLALFRGAYLDPVYRYHFLKPPGGEENIEGTLRAIARDNAWLVLGAPAAAAAFLGLMRSVAPRPGRSGSGRREARAPSRSEAVSVAAAGLLGAGFHLLFLLSLTRVYTFYAVPAFAGLAVAGGVGYAAVLEGFYRAIRSRSGRRLLLGSVCLILLAAPVAARALLQREADRDDDGPARRYVWQEAPLPAFLNSAVRALLWRDERFPGSMAPAATRYLWHESRHFQAAARLAERVRDLTPPGGAIFGDSLGAPLVALLAGRRIAADEADTNSMRFRSGITPPQRVMERLAADPPAAVIAAPRRGFYLLPEWRQWVSANYRQVESFNDPIHGTYNLYLENPADRGASR